MRMLAAAALALLASLAHAQLQGRDIDGNGSIDAFYDVAQNISWLADANHYATLGGPLNQPYWSTPANPGYLEPGELRLSNAFSFLQTLDVAGVTGWRLPSRLVPAGDPTGTRHNCDAAECDQRGPWPTELTNMLASNPGAVESFVNVVNGYYITYSGPIRPQTNDYVTLVNPYSPDINYVSDETGLLAGYVWAVHDGDVGAGAVTPVPEPGTLALIGVALLALALHMKAPALGKLKP